MATMKDKVPDPLAGGDEAPRLALRPADAARAIGISTRLLWSMTNRGDIPCVRIGRRIVYPLHLLREWLDTNAKGAGR